MAFVQHPGSYAGQPIEWTMDESKSGLPQFVVTFKLVGCWDGKEWMPCAEAEIRGYFYLIKKDGARNDVTVESLMKVFDWDGLSFEKLHSGDYSKVQCQVEVKEEIYNGQKRLKVGFINPGNYEGPKLDRQLVATVQDMDARWGGILKSGGPPAVNGSTRPSRALPNVLERASAVSQLKSAAPEPPVDLDIKEENIPF